MNIFDIILSGILFILTIASIVLKCMGYFGKGLPILMLIIDLFWVYILLK